MNFNPIILSIPVYFFLILIELLFAWIKNRKVYRLGDAMANIGCGIFEQVTGLFVKVFTVGLFAVCYEYLRIFTIPVNVWTIIILWIGIDFLYYWAHRLSHEVNLFWVGHVVHHQSEDYNLSVALRQGALQKFFTSPFYIPLAILGFSPEWFLLIGAFNTLYQFWIHTEFIEKMGWFEWIFNTPSHHRVHHGRDPKYIDKNHGGSLIIWDRLFGTFQAEEERPNYGITKPTFTFNSVNAHWKAIVDLYQEVKSANGFDKGRVLFMGPGWITRESLNKPKGGYVKFQFHPEKKIQFFLIIQFILLLGITSVYLFNFQSLNVYYQIGGALFISFSLTSIGNAYEQKANAFWLELIKWLMLTGLLIMNLDWIYFGLASLIAGIISTFTLYSLINKNQLEVP